MAEENLLDENLINFDLLGENWVDFANEDTEDTESFHSNGFHELIDEIWLSETNTDHYEDGDESGEALYGFIDNENDKMYIQEMLTDILKQWQDFVELQVDDNGNYHNNKICELKNLMDRLMTTCLLELRNEIEWFVVSVNETIGDYSVHSIARHLKDEIIYKLESILKFLLSLMKF